MPKVHPIKTQFTAGEISPRLYSRPDTEGYQAGVRYTRNFIPFRHGPMHRRTGFKFVAEIPDLCGKVFGFQLTPENPTGDGFAIVASGDGKLRVIGATSSGEVLGTELLENSDFNGGSQGWTEDNLNGSVGFSATVGRARLTPTITEGNYAGITQEADIETGKENDDHKVSFVATVPTTSPYPPLELRVGTSVGGDELGSKTFTLSGQGDITFNPAGATTVWVTIRAAGGKYKICEQEPGLPQFCTGDDKRDVTSVSCKAVTAITEAGIEFNHPWNCDQIPFVYAEMVPGEDTMWFVNGEVAPQKLEYDADADSWNFEALTITSTPAEWGDGNWPSVLAFHQGRSWWGGLAKQPETFWASKSGDFDNLDQGTAQPDDGLEFDITRRGKIRWIESAQKLLVGTTNAEYIVDSQDGVILPDDIQVTQQSANGSALVQSEPIGNLVLYVSPDRRKLRTAIFRWTEQAWVSRDVTFASEHLTIESRIKDISYTKDPESVIWMTTTDGKLLGCTYEPYTEVSGWHVHETQGLVSSADVIEQDGESVLYCLVERVIDGQQKLYLESFADNGAAYQDSWFLIQNDTPTDQISGVTHLAGQTVQVVVDGAVHPDITLDSNGDGVLNYKGTNVLVGLEYEATMETLPADWGANTGSAMSMQKSWNRIVIRVIGSTRPLINGQRPPDRSPETQMNTREPYVTEDVEVSNLGYNDGSIVISENLPLSVTVSGIFGEMTQDSL